MRQNNDENKAGEEGRHVHDIGPAKGVRHGGSAAQAWVFQETGADT